MEFMCAHQFYAVHNQSTLSVCSYKPVSVVYCIENLWIFRDFRAFAQNQEIEEKIPSIEQMTKGPSEMFLWINSAVEQGL